MALFWPKAFSLRKGICSANNCKHSLWFSCFLKPKEGVSTLAECRKNVTYKFLLKNMVEFPWLFYDNLGEGQ